MTGIMCTTCGKHNAESIWYLEEERHRIRSLGRFRDIVSKNLNPLITAGAEARQTQAARLPRLEDGLREQGPARLVCEDPARHAIPARHDSAFNVIDMANELALMPCLCRLAMDPEEPPVYRCIAMNIAARIYFRQDMKVDCEAARASSRPKQLVSRMAGKGRLAERRLAMGRQRHLGLQLRRALRGLSGAGGDLGRDSELPGLDRGRPLRLLRLPAVRQLVQARSLVLRRERTSPSWMRAACKGCGLCIENCPTDALVLRAPPDLLRHPTKIGQEPRQRDGPSRLREAVPPGCEARIS